MLVPAILLAMAPAPQAASHPPKDPDKIICRRENTTGSRLSSKKICMTRAEWDERQRNASRETQRMADKVVCAEFGGPSC